jgi:flagellar hook assembly protein FlgD
MKVLIFLLIFSFSSLLGNDIQIHTKNVYFSPNYDGHLDNILFEVQSNQKQAFLDWRFTIKDETGKLVQEYFADQRKKRDSSFWNFLKSSSKVIEKKIFLPKQIQWTGIGKNGKIPPDGRYIYQMVARLPDGGEVRSKEYYLYLDSNSPMSKLQSEIRTFSPNGDKIWDNVTIRQEIIGETSDRWRGTFRNAKNLPIKTFIWEHTKVPKVFTWDGKDDRGIPQDEGMYVYELTGEDFSENVFTSSLSEIILQKTAYSVDAYTLTDRFFPNGDKIDENISFRFNVSEKRVQSWKFSITNSSGKEQKQWSGSDMIPQSLDWDGTDESGKPVPTGKYFFVMDVVFLGDRKVSSKKGNFELNRNPIELKFLVTPKHFTPDSDGVDDVLEIRPSFQNLTIRNWKLSLIEKYGKESPQKKKIVKQWKAFGKPPERIVWEGITDSGSVIGSLAELELYFSFRNDRGEYKTFLVKQFKTGISVMPISQNNLKISIPEYIWKDREKEVLSNVKKTLSEYPGYRVEVLSHSLQLGDNKANLKKTEVRAKDVFERLFGLVATNNRYSYRGLGEVEPLFVEQDDFHQEKNDRLEFILSLPKDIR